MPDRHDVTDGAIVPATDTSEEPSVLEQLGTDLRLGRTEVAPETAAASVRTEPSLTLDVVRADPAVQAYIRRTRIVACLALPSMAFGM